MATQSGCQPSLNSAAHMVHGLLFSKEFGYHGLEKPIIPSNENNRLLLELARHLPAFTAMLEWWPRCPRAIVELMASYMIPLIDYANALFQHDKPRSMDFYGIAAYLVLIV